MGTGFPLAPGNSTEDERLGGKGKFAEGHNLWVIDARAGQNLGETVVVERRENAKSFMGVVDLSKIYR